jgi:polysaccharide pyruvyl transferase WcaK-like protein
MGVRTATYAIGAGPLERPHERRAVADVLNGMAAITVRDVRTRRLLQEAGVERDVSVTADPALLLESDTAGDGSFLPRGRRHQVGMSVREPGGAVDDPGQDGYHQLLAHAAGFVASRYDAELVFVPMEHGDIRHAHRVSARWRCLTERSSSTRFARRARCWP